MKRFIPLLSAIALALPFAAQATITFKFDPTGAGGGAIIADSFDFKPGNALAVGGNPLADGETTKLLYQANINTLELGGSSVYSNGSSGSFFTVVAGFKETAAISTGASSVTADFTLASAAARSADNYFYIYKTAAQGNNLSGVGFATGDLIMSGYISAVTSSNFTLSTTKAPVALDQFGSNDWAGTSTLIGSGATDLVVTIESVNAGYFPDLLSGSAIKLGFVNNSQVDPFKQVDPSKKFSSDGLSNADYAANIGAINGFSTTGGSFDFIFQADGNMSVDVPEPGSLALVGLALGAAGLAARRRQAK